MKQLLDAFIGSWYFKVFAISWIGLWILASVIYRRWNGTYILRPKFPYPLFEETRASGRSLRSFVTRLGGARHCLWLVITGDMLHIGPHFPFNLMFLPEVYGLEHHVPASNIVAVEKIDRWLRRPKVRITVRPGLIGEESFEIENKRSDEFIAALDQIRSGIPSEK